MTETIDSSSRTPHISVPSPADSNTVLDRNISALRAKKKREDDAASLQDRIAEIVTRFSGSMTFVAIHVVVVAAWVLVNVGVLPVIEPFDPSFVILATCASVEAIFLSTFVLISQNKAAAAADRRAELDLQTSLLAEHEITRLLELTVAIAQRMGIQDARDPSLDELKQHVAPEKVLDRLGRSDDA